MHAMSRNVWDVVCQVSGGLSRVDGILGVKENLEDFAGERQRGVL